MRSCFIIIRRKWSAEALRWLTRGGQSVRLPELPAFPYNVEEEHHDQADQPDQPKQNNLLVKAVEPDINSVSPLHGLHVDEQEQPIQLNHVEEASRNLQQITAGKRGKRRVSVAGGIFFSVNDEVRETGSDFLTKPIMVSHVIAQPAQRAQPTRPAHTNVIVHRSTHCSK